MGDPNSWMVHSGKSDSSCLKWQIYGYIIWLDVFFLMEISIQLKWMKLCAYARDLGNLRIKEKLFKSSGIGRIKHVKHVQSQMDCYPTVLALALEGKS